MWKASGSALSSVLRVYFIPAILQGASTIIIPTLHMGKLIQGGSGFA